MSWEEKFDVEFDDCKVVHVYETEQFKKIKKFIKDTLEERENDLVEGIKEIKIRCAKCDGATGLLNHTLACQMRHQIITMIKKGK